MDADRPEAERAVLAEPPPGADHVASHDAVGIGDEAQLGHELLTGSQGAKKTHLDRLVAPIAVGRTPPTVSVSTAGWSTCRSRRMTIRIEATLPRGSPPRAGLAGRPASGVRVGACPRSRPTNSTRETIEGAGHDPQLHVPDLYVGLVLRATRQAVVDFIAGMSESAALELFQGMSGVSSGSVLDAAARMV